MRGLLSIARRKSAYQHWPTDWLTEESKMYRGTSRYNEQKVIGRSLVCKLLFLGFRVSYVLYWAGRSGAGSRQGKRGISLLWNLQTGSNVHPAPYWMGKVLLSPGLRRPGCEADNWNSSSEEHKKKCSYNSTSHCIFIECTGTVSYFVIFY